MMVVIIGFMIPVNAEATTVTADNKIPISISVFVPCAVGGIGEVVDLSGELIGRQWRFPFEIVFQGVSGMGQTSGDKYQSTGVTQSDFNGNVRSEYTFVNNFRIIDQGSGKIT